MQDSSYKHLRTCAVQGGGDSAPYRGCIQTWKAPSRWTKMAALAAAGNSPLRMVYVRSSGFWMGCNG